MVGGLREPGGGSVSRCKANPRRQSVTIYEAIRRCVEWVNRPQPSGAVIQHHPVPIAQTHNWVMSIAAHGSDSGVLVVERLSPRWSGDGELKLLNPIRAHHMRRFREALGAVPGCKLLESWNGEGLATVSFRIRCAVNPSLQRALKRYRDGCPDCGGSVFCTDFSHPWFQGFGKAITCWEGGE